MKYKVYNKHPLGFTHVEKFREETVTIKSGDYILMDYEDAILFKGQYFPIKLDAMNQQDPKSYKCILIEPDGKPEEPVLQKIYVCQADGKQFNSLDELNKYVDQNYKHLNFVDESVEAEIVKSKKK